MDKQVEKRQKFLTPFTLRMHQLASCFYKSIPATANGQNYSPAFIIGSGRCGSTLLRSLLITHPDLHIPPESAALPGTIKKFYRYNASDWKDLVNICIGEFTSYGAYEFWEISSLDRLRLQLYDLPKSEQSLAVIIDGIFKQHLNQNKPTAKVWADKTTFNTLRLPWINKVFPNAMYINLVRDGRDVVSSYLKSGLITNVEDACWRWNESIARAKKMESKKEASMFINVKYEDLVTNPNEVATSVLDFMQLDASKANFSARSAAEMGDVKLAHHENVHNEISTKSLGKWKDNLTPTQQETCKRLLKSNLDLLGYTS